MPPIVKFQFSPIVPLFFTIDASAIRLPVEAQTFGLVNTLFPARAEVFVEKGHPDGFCDGLAYGADQLMLLKLGIEQGGGETIKSAVFGDAGGRLQPVVVAIGAAFGFTKRYVAQKVFQMITLLVDHPQIDALRVPVKRFLATQTLSVGMNVVAVKKAHDVQAFRT